MVSATTLLNLYDELSECCYETKTQSVGKFAYIYHLFV